MLLVMLGINAVVYHRLLDPKMAQWESVGGHR